MRWNVLTAPLYSLDICKLNCFAKGQKEHKLVGELRKILNSIFPTLHPRLPMVLHWEQHWVVSCLDRWIWLRQATSSQNFWPGGDCSFWVLQEHSTSALPSFHPANLPACGEQPCPIHSYRHRIEREGDGSGNVQVEVRGSTRPQHTNLFWLKLLWNHRLSGKCSF